MYFYGLTIKILNFAFEVKVILDLERTLLSVGWVAGICKTITNLASAEADIETRLSLTIFTSSELSKVRSTLHIIDCIHF